MNTIKLTTVLLLALDIIAQPAPASLIRIPITPQNQKEKGIDFTLSKEVNCNFYNIRLVATKKGKLEKLRHVSLSVGDDQERLLWVPIHQDPAVGDYRFSVNRKLVNKSSLQLTCSDPERPEAEIRHEIALLPYLEKSVSAGILTEDDAIALARKAIQERETWPHGAEFKAKFFDNRWHVTAWRIVYPEKEGSSRFVPGGFVSITLSLDGKIIEFVHGH